MSEQLNGSPNIAPQAELSPAQEAFSTKLQELGDVIPEIATRSEQIMGEAGDMIDGMRIERDFFDDTARTLIFAGLVNRYSKAQETKSEKPRLEQAFLLGAIANVVHNYELSLTADESIEAEKQAIYDRYTDKNLSSELAKAISDGLLDGVKQRMQIDESNEEPFDVRVLSIDSGINLGGLRPSYYQWDDTKSVAENQKAYDDHERENKPIKEYGEGLKERAKDFRQQIGKDSEHFVAWITKINGRNQICVTMPLAEKLLHPELTENNEYYDDSAKEKDLAVLEHEFVHTQSPMNLDDSTFAGIALEEVRAEYFSGDKHGYQDVKGLFVDVHVITGVEVRNAFDNLPKGGGAYNAFELLAREIGLDAMVELALIVPQNYCHESNAQSETYKHLGGYDGILERMLVKQLENGDHEAIEKRVDERAEYMERAAGSHLEFILSYRKEHDLNIVTDIVRDRIRTKNRKKR